MTQDEKYITRAIALSEESLNSGDSPFGCVIIQNDKIIAESGNRIKLDNDVTQHAEILAMRKAQRVLNSPDLSNCTIYSNCEPCPMCSFMIRELKFARVVFSVYSPNMGGSSKWNILNDQDLSTFKNYFGKVPQVIGGILTELAIKTLERSPEIYQGFKKRQAKQRLYSL